MHKHIGTKSGPPISYLILKRNIQDLRQRLQCGAEITVVANSIHQRNQLNPFVSVYINNVAAADSYHNKNGKKKRILLLGLPSYVLCGVNWRDTGTINKRNDIR